jgi:hypothetical protein
MSPTATQTKPGTKPDSKPQSAVKVDARTPTDFGALMAEEVAPVASVRGNEIDQYPALIAAVKNSKDTGKGGLIPPRTAPMLANDDAVKLTRLLRQAAGKLELGLSVGLVTDVEGKPGNWTRVSDKYTGPARVRFQAKTKREHDPLKPRRPTKTKGETDEAYAARFESYRREVQRWNATHADAQITVREPESASK